MNEKKELSPTDKTCPLMIFAGVTDPEEVKCIGENCAAYLKMMKPRVFGAGQNAYPDPETYLRYEGCGLVTLIPWQVAKRAVPAR